MVSTRQGLMAPRFAPAGIGKKNLFFFDFGVPIPVFGLEFLLLRARSRRAEAGSTRSTHISRHRRRKGPHRRGRRRRGMVSRESPLDALRFRLTSTRGDDSSLEWTHLCKESSLRIGNRADKARGSDPGAMGGTSDGALPGRPNALGPARVHPPPTSRTHPRPIRKRPIDHQRSGNPPRHRFKTKKANRITCLANQQAFGKISIDIPCSGGFHEGPYAVYRHIRH
ncbi:hypothetical protein SCOR_22265 [Sulfidibacter corallicola]